jgi:hypothetical protein
MTDYGPAPSATERVTTASEARRERARPQWGWFAPFGLNVVIHLIGGWDTTATIGAGLGLAVTLGLVFFPALRRNRLFRIIRATSCDPGRLRQRGVFLTWAAWGWGALLGFLLFVVFFVSPPHDTDVLYAGFVLVVALVPLPVVLVRRRREARWLHLLEAGPPTRITAAVEAFGYWDGDDRRSVRGWTVLPGGLRTRFRIEECPRDLYAAIHVGRAAWVVGEPRLGEVALGLPDRRLFAVARFATKRRYWVRRPPSSTPPGIGVQRPLGGAGEDEGGPSRGGR